MKKQKTPKLGQHFLTSRSALSAIIDAADITPKETVVEIGPGKGVLTEELLRWSKQVIAIEKDERLADALRERFREEVRKEKLVIICADIRNVTVALLGVRAGEYQLVANIPYYITGEIIRMFLESDVQPRSMTLLLQDEVARRIAKDKKESILSLSVKAYGTPRYVQKVPRGAFAPAPRIDSAILHIADISKRNFQGSPEEHFFSLIHAGFAAKRKQLIGNLTALAPREKVEVIFSALSIPLTTRAEDVPLHTWLALARALR